MLHSVFSNIAPLYFSKNNCVMKNTPLKSSWISPLQRPARKICALYLITTAATILFFVLPGLDTEEFVLVFIPLVLISGVYLRIVYKDISLSPADCSTVKDKYINLYFILFLVTLSGKALFNIPSYDWMLCLIGVYTIIFNAYIVIHWLGVGGGGYQTH